MVKKIIYLQLLKKIIKDKKNINRYILDYIVQTYNIQFGLYNFKKTLKLYNLNISFFEIK